METISNVLECDICTSQYSSSKQLIDCSCGLTYCGQCLTNPNWIRPQCFQCNKILTRLELTNLLGRDRYHNTIRAHFTEMYFNREHQLLPITQKYIEWLEYRKEYRKYKRWGPQMEKRGFVRKPELEYGIQLFLADVNGAMGYFANNSNHFPCTKHQCRGLVVLGFCGICKQQHCLKCQMPISGSHQCDPSILQSIKQIAQKCKNCPTCHVLIQRSHGCNHMRCTNCGTYFDWKTGHIQGRNTNPIRNNELFGVVKKNSILTIPTLTEEQLNHSECIWTKDLAIISTFMKTKFNVKKLLDKHPISLLKLKVDYLQTTLSEEQFKEKITQLEENLDYHQQMNQLISRFLTQIQIIKDHGKNLQDRADLINLSNTQSEQIAYSYDKPRVIFKLKTDDSYPIKLVRR